jgi:hypothetical protein
VGERLRAGARRRRDASAHGVADRAGGDWSTKSRIAALVISGAEADTGSMGVRSLADIRRALQPGEDSLFTRNLRPNSPRPILGSQTSARPSNCAAGTWTWTFRKAKTAQGEDLGGRPPPCAATAADLATTSFRRPLKPTMYRQTNSPAALASAAGSQAPIEQCFTGQ